METRDRGIKLQVVCCVYGVGQGKDVGGRESDEKTKRKRECVH